MTEPLDESYFKWLYAKVANPRLKRKSLTYWRLFRLLYKKEFVWFVPNDNNRIEDGKDLRLEFLDEFAIQDVDSGWLHLGCSMLELLVGLAKRLEFQGGHDVEFWFWHLMRNLGIDYIHDATEQYSEPAIDERLDAVIFRTYQDNGHGGLFPLVNSEQDQRKVEIWYQLCAYLLERL